MESPHANKTTMSHIKQHFTHTKILLRRSTSIMVLVYVLLFFKSAAAASDAPAVSFSATTHNFGSVIQNLKLDHAFTFKNTGTATLRIRQIKSTCGCTAAMASSRKIEPGKEGKISVTFSAGSIPGPTSKKIIVYTNDPRNKAVKLNIKADVRVLLITKPRRINFGKQPKGTSITKYAALEGEDKKKAAITSATSSSNYINVETNSTGFDNNTDKNIRFDLLPGMPVGRFREEITFATTHPEISRLKMFIYGEITGPIRVQPHQVSFGMISPGKALDRTIHLSTANDTSFSIRSVTSTIENLELATEIITEGSEYIIHARLNEQFNKPMVKGSVIITTDNENQPEIEVKFFGRTIKQE